MRFRYQTYAVPTPHGQVHAHRPMVPARIIGPGGDAFPLGRADTGADLTLISTSLLAVLGVTLNSADSEDIDGIDGKKVMVYHANVDLELRRQRRVYRWGATVAFYAGTRTIFGHTGFLDHFRSTFQPALGHFTLTPNGTFPPPSMTMP